MSSEPAAPGLTVIDRADAPNPGCAGIFIAFFTVGVSAFGGALPWSRRMIVERRKWLTAQEFTDVLALCQFLPGPNTVNLAVVLGARYRGWRGALAALAGLLSAPLVIVSILGAVYARFATVPIVARSMAAFAAGASGLVLATAFKIARPLRRSPRGIAIAIGACVAIVFGHLSLLLTMVVALPLSVALARPR